MPWFKECRKADTEVGPLIDPAEVTRVGHWVNEAVAEGAELICGGKPLSNTCFECTVLLNPPDSAKLSTKEVFGPVVLPDPPVRRPTYEVVDRPRLDDRRR